MHFYHKNVWQTDLSLKDRAGGGDEEDKTDSPHTAVLIIF